MRIESRHLLPSLVLAGGFAAVLYLEILWIGSQEVFNIDGQVLYAAGRAWLQGANPYDFDALSRSIAGVPGLNLDTGINAIRFFYPPQSAGFCVPLGLLPYLLARIAWLMLNLLALASIVVLTWSSLRKADEGTRDAWGPWLLAAVIIASPFTLRVIFMGQTSLLAFAATLGAWSFAGRKKWVAAGLCLGLASFKPQICVLVVLWFVLERDWKTLLVGAVAAAALAAVPMASQGGPIGALQAWRAGVNADYAMQFNLPTWPHKVGAQSVLSLLGIPVPGSVFLGISVLSTLALWWLRDRISRRDVLALLMIITLTFSTYMHDYDYVVLAPVYASLWWYSRKSDAVMALSIVLLVMLFTPQDLVRLFGHQILEQWRTGVVILMGAIVLAYSAASIARHERSRISA